jgi:hypothetical protein
MKATIINNNLVFDFPAQWIEALAKYNGKRVNITIKKEVKARTLSQNKYYWVVIHMIANETGDDPVSLHEGFKMRFLPGINSLGYEYARSTTGLDTAEFTKYLDSIRQLALEFGIDVPSPDNKEMVEFYSTYYGI